MARTSNRPRARSPLNLPRARDLFAPSKELVLKNIWVFGPLYAVTLIFDLHSWIWSPAPVTGQHWTDHIDGFGSGLSFSPASGYAISAIIGFSLFWLIFVLAVGTIVQIMSQAAQLDAVEHKPLDFQNLWKVVKELGWRMFGLYMLTALYIVVGLILLIVPGLIMIRRYIMAPYVMLDERCGIQEAMERSAAMTKRHSGSVWGILGILFLISVIAAIPFIGGLAAFILGALYSVAPALRYQELKKLAA